MPRKHLAGIAINGRLFMQRLIRTINRVLGRNKVKVRSLEINMTAHCNLKCYGCGRGSPALPEEFLSIDGLTKDLSVLSKVIHLHEFKLAGGEPLMHPDLLQVIKTIRHSGITDNITLITNGVLLHNMGPELWDGIDEIWVSNYPGVRLRSTQDEVFALGAKHNVRIEYNLMKTFTRRVLNTPIADDKLVTEIFSRCYQRLGCHSLYAGKLFQCATGPFVPKWLEQVGDVKDDFSADGIDIHNTPNLKSVIKEYLARSEPLAASRYCLAGLGKSFENHQLNKQGVEGWLAESHPNPEDLIDPVIFEATKPIIEADSYEQYGKRIDFP
jgi:organic radical activating enzyme